MKKWHVIWIAVLSCVGIVRAQNASIQTSASEAVVKKYCVTCHNLRLKTAGLALDTLDVTHPGDNAATWEKVIRKLRAREMPPASAPRPDNAAYNSTIAWLETELDKAAASHPNTGRIAVHRLNRTEYANAVRDLFGIEIDASSILPGDVPDRQSFDNMASVLSVSPALLENYLSAALTVSRLAIADATASPPVTFKVPVNLNQDDWMGEELPFGSQGGLVVRHYFPRDGQYTITVRLRRQLYDYIIGMAEPHQIDIRLDGARIKRFTIGGEAKGMTTPETFPGDTQGDLEWEEYMHTADGGLEVVVSVKAGMRQIGVSFVRSFWEPETIPQPSQVESFARTDDEHYFGHPGVGMISISGPMKETGPAADSTNRAKVFLCWPRAGEADEPCARKILSSVARRAYRRPLTDQEVATVSEFYKDGRPRGFDAGIQRGLERILAAPSFIFRVENNPKDAVSKSLRRVSDIDLASRLSFFLWSSIPDDELLDVAAKNKLHEPAVLEAQIRRMMRDSRSDALVDNFAKQWLKLDSLAAFTPDIYEFPDFDENLRKAMLEETRLFILSQIEEDQPLINLLTADYTFVNQRLANHYGIANVYGSHFRRVTFQDGIRGGLLAQASILTVTSYANRTSPVLRGKWLLDNILGSPVPPPPPNVPALKEGGAEGQPRSIRERMDLHRKNPVCAGCHQRMDPLGYSLENFGALGQWRTTSDGVPVDATASLIDGTRFDGVGGLRRLLVNRRDDFVRTIVEKLMAYAIGRGLEYYDYPSVRKIMRTAAGVDYRWSSIIAGIAESIPFTMTSSSGDTDSRRMAQ